MTTSVTSLIKKSLPDGNLELNEVPEKLTTYLSTISEYLLPFLVLFAIIIAGTFVMFSHPNGWKRVALATGGAVIMFMAINFLVTLKDMIQKDSEHTEILRLLETIFVYLKKLTDGILPIAATLSFITAAGCIMFSNHTGWKKLVNATLGSIITFGAILIVNFIVNRFRPS